MPGEPDETADRLLETANRQLAASDVVMANVLLDTVSETDDAVLFAGGYRQLAKLLYLFCVEEEFPPVRPSGPLEFEPYTEADHDRLVQLIEATYEQTLDCPRLNNVRRTADVLEGYRQTGVFDPSRWLIVRHQGRDVGCLIVTRPPRAWELRADLHGADRLVAGARLGEEHCPTCQWLTALAGRVRLVVAVDAANAPAIDMYTSVGFHAWDRRTVYGKVFGSAD